MLSQVRRLVFAAFGGAFSEYDWEHTFGGWHVVASEAGVPVSHAAVVVRTLEVGDRSLRSGYVEGVATDPVVQGQGLGSAVMAKAAELVRPEFEMGALSTAVTSFYTPLGWEVWRGPTYVRHGLELVRSENDDGGVMVLRFGPSASVDLTSSIACETRDGDDW